MHGLRILVFYILIVVTKLRACLAQLNFTSETVLLENSFMSNFAGEAELFWKKCLVK